MTRIHFSPSGIEMEITKHERLLDVIDELPGNHIPLSCRAAHCGLCRVRVRRGHSQLLPAQANERVTLDAMGANRDERLACQLRLCDDAEVIELEVLPVPA